MPGLPPTDPAWWAGQSYEGRPLHEILHARDIGTLFRFLNGNGWSRAAIAAACGLSETRVRAIILGRQKVTSYEVLERIARGLRIPPGWIGLAYTDGACSTAEKGDVRSTGRDPERCACRALRDGASAEEFLRRLCSVLLDRQTRAAHTRSSAGSSRSPKGSA